jgi:hypothetical protein
MHLILQHEASAGERRNRRIQILAEWTDNIAKEAVTEFDRVLGVITSGLWFSER